MVKNVSDETLSKIVELYNSGFTYSKGIAGKLDLDSSTVNRALRYAHSVGLIKYVAGKPWGTQKASDKSFQPKKKAVYCITLDKSFNSITDASLFTGCTNLGISMCCKGEKESCSSARDKQRYEFKFI